MKKYLAIVLMLSMLMCSATLISCGKADKSDKKLPPEQNKMSVSSNNATTTEEQTGEKKENNTVAYIDPEPDYSYLTGPTPDYSYLPEDWLTPYTTFAIDSVTDCYIELPQFPDMPEQWFTEFGEFQNEKAPAKASITVADKEYTLPYNKSRQYSLYADINVGERYCYGNEFSSDGYLEVDASTGKILRWKKEYSIQEYREKIETKNFDGQIQQVYSIEIDELRTKTYEYMSALLGDEQLSQYEFEMESGRIYLYRRINGYRTNEYIFVDLTSDGTELFGFAFYNVGLYNDVSDFAFNENKAEAVVKSNIKEAFADRNYKIESMDIVVRMLPNGQMAYEYTTDVMYFHQFLEDGAEAWGGVRLTFIIPAE